MNVSSVSMADLENEFDQAEQTVLSSYADALSGGSELMMTMPALADAGTCVQWIFFASMQQAMHELCFRSVHVQRFAMRWLCICLHSRVMNLMHACLLIDNCGWADEV